MATDYWYCVHFVLRTVLNMDNRVLTPFPCRGIAYVPPSLVGTFRRAGRGEGGSPGGPCRLPGTARGR